MNWLVSAGLGLVFPCAVLVYQLSGIDPFGLFLVMVCGLTVSPITIVWEARLMFTKCEAGAALVIPVLAIFANTVLLVGSLVGFGFVGGTGRGN
jgi:hypothetical protein